MNETRTQTPVHLWIVGILALLWNAIGCFDYFATQTKAEWYMSHFTPQQLEYFYAFPAWVDAAWAVGVWGSLLGAIGLLLRKAWSVWLFGLSILGLAGTAVYNFVLTDGMAVMGTGAAIFSGIIGIILLF